MADLTERQKQEYWRYNITLTTILLVIWFVVTYLISGLWAGWLNQYSDPRLPARLLHGGAGVARDLRGRDRGLRLPDEPEGSRVRHPRGGLDRHVVPGEDLRALHGRVPRHHGAHRDRGAIGLFSNQMIGWIFMALSLAIYVMIGVLTRTSNPDQYYVAGRGRARGLQRHGHRFGLDVGRVVHLDGRGCSRRSGFVGLGLRHGVDRRLPPARRLPGPVPPAVRGVHDPGFPGRPLRRQHPAHHRAWSAPSLLVHLPDRPGDGRRPHRGPLHRHRLQHRGVRRVSSACCSARCSAG